MVNGVGMERLACLQQTEIESKFFFLQAEDGIRVLTVTGVQTCALPICSVGAVAFRGCALFPWVRCATHGNNRSEERRVGKECRSRWSAYHSKKKRRSIPDNARSQHDQEDIRDNGCCVYYG